AARSSGAASAHHRGEGVRQVMKVQHCIVDALSREPLQNPLNNGAVANWKRRFGANKRKRTEAGSQTRGQHERWDHASTLTGMTLSVSKGHSSLKTMFVPVRPNSSRCLMNRAR